MSRNDRFSWTWPILAAVAITWGCGKSETPTLNIGASSSSSTSDSHRLVGTWDGQFVFHNDVDKEAFDQVTLEACKSMKLRVTFRSDGTMSMAATVTLPEVGTQSNQSEGKWSFVQRQGETITIRSQEDNAEPEEVSLHFRGADVFEMLPPNQLKSLGVMRFVRQAEQ